MLLLFKNIKELIQVRETDTTWVVGADMKKLPTIRNAYLLIEDELIVDYGTMDDCPMICVDQVVDATGKMILPTWCDSHTHIVYAGHREEEFVDRINGMSYEEISSKGGGILNSVIKLNNTSEEDLFQQSKVRLEDMIRLGTGAVEIKSGYGLSLEGELKMLRVIKRLKKDYPVVIKATFLGAHAIPPLYQEQKEAYLTLLTDELIPKIASEGLAEYIDVFCEQGYYSVEDTNFVLAAGRRYGLTPKIHVNQFNSLGGVQVGVQNKALSVDHLELIRQEDIEALKNSCTMPVALPTCSFFLGIPYTPARKILDEGLPIALATDYNPGSSPSGNMNFVVAIACIKMNMTPEEAINAATINGAYAMGVSLELGSITKGKLANIMMTKPINSYACIPYSFGQDQIEKVFIKGVEWTS